MARARGHEAYRRAHIAATPTSRHGLHDPAAATYCRPEIASIGLTEAQATEKGHKVKIGKVPFQAIAKALIGG